MHRFLYTIIAFLIITPSCRQAEKPLTKEEVLDFGKKIETSIAKRHNKMLDQAIDEKALLKHMNYKSGKDSRTILSVLKKDMKMGTRITESLTAKGSYSLIKHYEKDKVHHLLFRMYDDGGINYHDYELIRTDGQPKVADIYIYITGEKFSETLKNLFIQLNDEVKGSSRNKSDSWLDKVPEIRSMIATGKYQEALEIYNNIPAKIKKGRIFQIMHVTICSGLQEEEYSKAIAEYEALYPNEPNMQLLLIDGYFLHNDYEKALTAVNELDKMVDKDPLLDLHRASCYKLMNEYGKRTECLERLVKNMPDFEDGIIVLVANYLEDHEFEKAKPLIDDFKIRSRFNQSTLTTLLDQYPGYNEKYGEN